MGKLSTHVCLKKSMSAKAEYIAHTARRYSAYFEEGNEHLKTQDQHDYCPVI